MLRILLAVILLCMGCDPPLDTRSALIVQTMVDADRDLIASRPQLVADKYEKMASGLQPFLRGSAQLFYRDLSRYRDSQGSVLHGKGAEFVRLYGDIHLENLGATFDVEGPLFDVIDFDATTHGPFGWELRRAALSLSVALSVAAVSPQNRQEVIRQLGRSYVQEVLKKSQQDVLTADVSRAGFPTESRIVTELLQDGQKRNEQQEEITQYTEWKDGARRFVRNAELQDLPSHWAAELPSMIREYRRNRHAGRGEDASFVIVDAIQRFGSGVASLPNLRFWVMVQGTRTGAAQQSPQGEWLLELKEERDPPFPTEWLGRGTLGTNAQRVFLGTLELSASATSEADLGHVLYGGVSFQVRRVLRGRRDLDVARLAERIASGRYVQRDLLDLGWIIGKLLAAGHAKNGNARAIADVLTQQDLDGTAVIEALIAASVLDEQRLNQDLFLFQEAILRRGPLLGARIP
jgi:uncharacterized protein (DUF2252 family)